MKISESYQSNSSFLSSGEKSKSLTTKEVQAKAVTSLYQQGKIHTGTQKVAYAYLYRTQEHVGHMHTCIHSHSHMYAHLVIKNRW